MDTILLYNKRAKPTDELEIIITEDKASTLNFVEKTDRDFVIHKHMDLFNGDNARSRLFISDKTRAPEKIIKTSVSSELINVGISLKVTLKEENPLHNFNISTVNKIRIKYTQSYNFGAWQLDISRIKTLLEKTNAPLYKGFLEAAESFTSKHLMDFTEYSVELEHLNPKGSGLAGLPLDRNFSQQVGKITYEDMILKLQEVLSVVDKKVLAYDALVRIAEIRAEHTRKNEGALTLKELLPNPVGLTKANYGPIYANMDDYMICEKTDGTRAALVVLSGKPDSSSLGNNRYYLIKDEPEIGDCTCPEMIIDGEFTDNVFYAFDLLFYGEDLCDKTYKERYDILVSITDFPINVVPKNIRPLAKETIKEVYAKSKIDNYPYKIDGLIITKASAPYFESPYKWKPIKDLSIDFLVLKPGPKTIPKSLAEPGKTIFYLYVTARKREAIEMGLTIEDTGIFTAKDRVPIKFTSPRRANMFVYKTSKKSIIESLSSPVIGEFRYDISGTSGANDGEWIFMRAREDRQSLLNSGTFFGNAYFVAQNTVEQYFNPFELKDLIDFNPKSYFRNTKDSIYKKINGTTSAVKESIFAMVSQGSSNQNYLGNSQGDDEMTTEIASKPVAPRHKEVTRLIDIGGGRGADMKRYKKYFTDVLMIEPDNDALSEAINRSTTIPGKLNLSILNDDITNHYKKIGKKLAPYRGWANMVTINFAIHYMIKSINHIEALADLVYDLLAEGGLFAFTCLNGAKVLKDLTASDNGEINLYENELLKYSIKSVKKSKEITSNVVDVLLPFSQGEYYRENLVDIKRIIQLFKEHDFELVKSEGYDTYLHTLNKLDQKYCYYNHYVVLKKA